MKKILLFLFALLIAGVVYQYFPQKKLPKNAVIDQLILQKNERKLNAYSNGKLLKSYTVSLGFNPKGHKHFEGDGKTPEGIYTIYDKNPRSVCYLNLGISYPSKQDIQYATQFDKKPGGAIKIHGINPKWAWIGKFHRWMDWSNGCICVTNPEIKELYDHVPIGTHIEIKP